MANNQQFTPYPDSGKLMASRTKRGPKSPDYWGEITIDLRKPENVQHDPQTGLTTFKLNGWKKTSQAGATYLSLAVDRFVPTAQAAPPAQAPAPQNDIDDSDIPFISASMLCDMEPPKARRLRRTTF